MEAELDLDVGFGAIPDPPKVDAGLVEKTEQKVSRPKTNYLIFSLDDDPTVEGEVWTLLGSHSAYNADSALREFCGENASGTYVATAASGWRPMVGQRTVKVEWSTA